MYLQGISNLGKAGIDSMTANTILSCENNKSRQAGVSELEPSAIAMNLQAPPSCPYQSCDYKPVIVVQIFGDPGPDV